MKKYLLLLLFLGITTLVHAQDSMKHKQKTALWKVTSAHRTMYITGGIGASLKKYPIPAVITQAFNKSDKLIMEGKTSASKKKKAALMRKYGLQPSGEKLNDDLDSLQLKLVKKSFSSLPIPQGLTLANIQSLQPWVVVMLLHKAKINVSEYQVKPHALYEHFHNKANNKGMPVTFLNTVAGEFKLYASMPQILWLMMETKNALKPEHPKKHAKLVQAWRKGNSEVVAKFYNNKFQSYPKVYSTLVTSYEPRWLKTLETELNKRGKPVFVIVNAVNLVGPINILNGLRKAGYQVSQL